MLGFLYSSSRVGVACIRRVDFLWHRYAYNNQHVVTVALRLGRVPATKGR